ALALAFDVALEPFARVKHLWLWQPTKISLNWQGASPMSFLGWFFVTALILAVTMPYFIRKQPGGSSAPIFPPRGPWLGAMLLFGINAAQAGMWAAVAAAGLFAVVVAALGWRGARW